MSAIKNANDIYIMKKKKKVLDCEASDYEFGFDGVPQRIKIVNKKMFLSNPKRDKIRKYNSKLLSRLNSVDCSWKYTKCNTIHQREREKCAITETDSSA